jgi:hypothetical protein
MSLAQRPCCATRVCGQAPRLHCARLFLSPRAGGWFLSCHCVTAFSCHAGARPLGACSPPLAALRDSLDRDPEARPGPGPLGVRKRRRHRHPVPVRALGPRGLGRHGRWHPPGGLNTPHPGTVPGRPGGGLSFRGCREWQISPEPAAPAKEAVTQWKRRSLPRTRRTSCFGPGRVRVQARRPSPRARRAGRRNE